MLISIFFGCSFLLLCSSEFAGKSSSKLKLRSLSPEDRCIADIQKQIKGRNLSKNLGGIVGVGWDSLTNEVTLPVFSQKYKLCRTVPDGDFLVPDNVMVLPIQEARISKSSEMHENFNSFKKSEGGSMTVSGGGGLPGIATVSGSLSVATKIGKEHMEKHKRTAFSNKIEYDAYTLIGTEKAGFDEVFQDRLNDILNA
uniref:Uncharacterized protein n=2 Tax=Panagrolaimus sp. ES5 TaxID=591445 RepID=A0AC34GIF8_9BILA